MFNSGAGPTDNNFVHEIESGDVTLQLAAYEAFGARFSCALVVFDPSLRVLWASPATGHVLDRSDDIVGSEVMDLIHPDDLEQIVPIVAGILADASETMESPAAPPRPRCRCGCVPTVGAGPR